MEIVNTICSADDDVGVENHKHQCDSCGTVWNHTDDCVNGTIEQFDYAHACPRCGEEQTKKLMSDEEAEAKYNALSEDEKLELMLLRLFR